MTFEELNKISNVSHETFLKLKEYASILEKWQKAINLVSKNTLKDIWRRHIIDSLQLNQYIDDGVKTVADLGSGAGFPGMVLAVTNNNIKTTLIESDIRKCEFLKEIRRSLSADVEIVNQRVESIDGRAFDLITSRALASIKDILEISENIANDNTIYLLLKGENIGEEMQHLKIDYQVFNSISKGKIIKFRRAR